MEAYYRFAVQFTVDSPPSMRLAPSVFSTQVRYAAADPTGTSDWLFFRDHLWRGEVNHPGHIGGVFEDHLGVPIESVSFRAFETDTEYLDTLKIAVSEHLEEFKADRVDEVLSKYFGSRIEVTTD